MLRILQLEDDPVDANLALRLLREGGLDVEIERVHTFAAFQHFLEHNSPALILADYTVPGVNVLSALQFARQAQPDVPFVFLSGTLGEDTAIETLKMGATDYVLKQRIGRLLPAVRRALQEAREQLQRKQAEKDLRESEGRYRALLESAPDAVVVYQDWRLVYLNSAALRLCGAAALDEVWGRDIFQFVPLREGEVARRSGQRLLEGAVMPLREGWIRRLDGKEVPVEVAGSRVWWLGQPAVQVIMRDITERKRTEEELKTAREQLVHANATLEKAVRERTAELREAIEDLHQFSYAIIHDMRAPLRAMHGFATLMQQENPGHDRPQNLDLLHRITMAAERLDSLIQDALTYSKVLQEKPALVPVDLTRLLRGIIDSYPSLRSAVADVCLEGPLPIVLGSESGLTQCFSNLLENAVKFVAPGVRPHIRIWAAAPPPGAPSEATPVPFTRILVQDNGIGIASEDQAHIFEMFHRLDQDAEGTGIGLAIVHKVIARLGGRVGLESTVGKGCTFWLELRQAADPMPSPQVRGLLSTPKRSLLL